MIIQLKKLTLNLLFASCSLLAANAFAEETPAPKEAAKPQAQIAPPGTLEAQPQPQMSLQQQFQAIRYQLQEVQNKVLEQSPELVKKGEALDALIESKMVAQGLDPDKDIARMDELKSQATADGVTDEQKNTLGTEFQEIQQRLMAARQMAMQSEDVQTQGEQFRSELIDAMKKEEPQTEQLLAMLQQIQQMAMQQQMQQQPPMQAPQASASPKPGSASAE